jgi:uncharacterized protein (TIGR03435 family)
MRIALALVSLAVGFPLALAAQPDAARPAFEVVSVKPTPPERINRLKYEKCDNGGPFIAQGVPLLWIVEFAYRVNDTDLAAGFPAWIESFADAYDIEGKPAGPVDDLQCRQMVQALLEDRFQLKIHRETRERGVYFLVIAKNGPKLREVKQDAPQTGGGVRINRALMQAPSEKEAPKGWSAAKLAGYLAGLPDVGRPVLDKTGLTGIYAFSLEFSRKEGDDRPAIFTAVQDQLGLKLDAGKAPLEMLVIDHVQRASGN